MGQAASAKSPQQIVRFGAFDLDRQSGELRKNGIRVGLQDQPLQVLVVLLERPGELVTREELRQRLWPADTFVDFEHGLNAAVKRLRDALGDSADTPRFVETVPRRGYRFIASLAPAHGDATSPPIGRPSAPSRSWLRWAAAILLLGGVGLSVWVAQRRTSDGRPTPAPPRALSGPSLVQLTQDSGVTIQPALSPDGQWVAYASDRSGEDNLDIWLLRIGDRNPIRLTRHPADDSEPAFSADGRIAFRSERDGGGVYVMPAHSGGVESLVAKEGRRPRFSPDGRWILFWTGPAGLGGDPDSAGLNGIFLVESTGGPPRRLQPEFGSAFWPVWSPDGKRVLFAGVPQPEGARDWWVAPIDGGRAVRTGAADTFARHQLGGLWVNAWLAEPDRILFSGWLGNSGDLWQVPIAPDTWQISSNPERVTAGTDLHRDPSVAGGRLVFCSLRRSVDLWSLPVDADQGKATGELQRVTRGPLHVSQPSVSSNGRTALFRSREGEVWILSTVDLESGRRTDLPVTPSYLDWPAVNAQGSKVAYRGPRTAGREEMYVVGTAGGAPERICADCGWGLVQGWSPDDAKILYLDNRGTMQVFALDVASGGKTLMLSHPDHNLYQAHLSPDGQWVAFLEWMAPDRARIAVAPFRDGIATPEAEWIGVTDMVSRSDKPRWSPDGTRLYFTSERDGFRCLWTQRLEPATKRPLGSPAALHHFHSPRLSLTNVPLGDLEISVARNKVIFNLGAMTGNIWTTTLGGSQ